MEPQDLLNIEEGVYRIHETANNPAADRRYQADWRYKDVFPKGSLYKIAFYEEEDRFRDKPPRIRRDIIIQRVNLTFTMRSAVSFPKEGDGDVRASFWGTKDKHRQAFEALIDALVPVEELEPILDATESYDLKMALTFLVKDGLVTKEQVLERITRHS